MDQHISRKLNHVVRRLLRLRRWSALSWLWAMTALVSAVLAMSMPPGEPVEAASGLVLGTAMLGSLWLLRPRRISDADRLATARLIENRWPSLNQRLLTVIEQTPDAQAGGFSWLQQELATEVRSHSYSTEWKQSVPAGRILAKATTACVGLLLSFLLALQVRSTPELSDVGANVSIDEPPTTDSLADFEVSIEPGTTEVERGTALLITATFAGRLPSSVTMLNLSDTSGLASSPELSGGDPSQNSKPSGRPMRQSLKDPLFGTRLPTVDAPFDYQIQYDDQKSDVFRISVYDLPQVMQVDATIEYPSYSDLPNELIEDTWRVSAVEGSAVVLTCRLNKSIADGRLVDRTGEEFKLMPTTGAAPADVPSTDDPETSATTSAVFYQARIPVDRTRKLSFRLKDGKGRQNREADEFVVTAIPNRPPEIKLTFPGRDLRVSPIEELQLEATVWDDFGITEHGIVLALADQESRTVTLGQKAAPRQKHELAHLLALELENAQPDQLVSYYFFADDISVSGQKRRTMSDMFFAEVRHFEEIFREGQSPPGGSPPAASASAKKAEELGELQKQIIAATWKVIRRETREEVSDTFIDDVSLLVESQQEAINQVSELMAELKDAQSRKFAEDVITDMKTAVVRLVRTQEVQKAEPLTSAMTSERSAYQGLLKLRAREHQVTQQQSSPSQSKGSGSASQQQLEQLELDNKKNRYEAEQNANQQQEQQNREELQVLNRLRELARRQSDLNQKLKELEHELKAAKTEEEQAEIERQLKRLREEQQEMLRDVDELKDRLEKPENQLEMADTREKLEETRSKVREASEALEKGKLSQALNEGTRAERDLEQLRDEVRQKAAGQFGDAMRELRQNAREIGERQDQIAEALQQTTPSQESRPSLRSSRKPSGEKLQNELDRQSEELDQVLEKMRDVVEKAETAEPLLARQLYETIRKTRADRASEALEETRNLNQRGLTKDAAVAERRAHEGLDRLQQGIERAAESVLGNELESLKRASRELADAGEAIRKELAETAPTELQKLQNGRGPDRTDPNANRNPDNSQTERSAPAQTGNASADRQTQQAESTDQSASQDQSDPAEAASQDDPGNENGPGSRDRGQPDSSQKPSESKATGGDSSAEGKASKESENPASPQGSSQSSNDANPSESAQASGAGSESGKPEQNPKGSEGAPTGSPKSGKGQPGQSPGEQTTSSGQPGSSSKASRQRQALRPSATSQSRPGPDSASTGQQSLGSTGPGNPITGEGFIEWSDQIRNIEELIDDPKMRAEVARIREAARSMRAEFKRHSKEPQWRLVRLEILEPLNELQEKLREEIARRESPDALVPIDRDPVPDKYAELVRRYYERLGSGK